MQVNYTYTKSRSDYGKQYRFTKTGPIILENLMPDPILAEQWLQKVTCNKSTLKAPVWSVHEANTTRVEKINRGICHMEGGWPKELNLDDPDLVDRYRKRAVKEEAYLSAIVKTNKAVNYFMKQNNAIDIYQSYFNDPICHQFKTLLDPNYRNVGEISDPCSPARPVQHLSWSTTDLRTLIAVSYGNLEFLANIEDNSSHAFIFDLAISNVPYLMIESPSPVICLEFNPKNGQYVGGGLLSGQVGVWDTRKGSTSVAITTDLMGHYETVKSLCWIQSKTGTEFISGSTDGQILWWDFKDLSEPTEVLLLDTKKSETEEEEIYIQECRSHPVSHIDYDPVIPSRFMVSTKTGILINCNRKGRTAFEKIASAFRCHNGMMYSSNKHPVFHKFFLTIGDHQAKIWTEDVRHSPILWTKVHDAKLLDGAWSRTKPSVFYTVRADGFLDCWDILKNQEEPVLSILVTYCAINCIRCHEDGALIALGDDRGKTHIIEMNSWFVIPDKNEKLLLTELFDRLTRKEKTFEMKQRLQNKTINTDTTAKDKRVVLVENEVRKILEIEEEIDSLLLRHDNEQEFHENEQEFNENEQEYSEHEKVLNKIY